MFNKIVLTTHLAQLSAIAITALFLYFGMDVRGEEGARRFVPAVWQIAMKIRMLARERRHPSTMLAWARSSART